MVPILKYIVIPEVALTFVFILSYFRNSGIFSQNIQFYTVFDKAQTFHIVV